MQDYTTSGNASKIKVERNMLAQPDQEAALSYWRTDYDPIYMHQLESRFADIDQNEGERDALSRWYVNDRKAKNLCKFHSVFLFAQSNVLLTISVLMKSTLQEEGLGVERHDSVSWRS